MRTQVIGLEFSEGVGKTSGKPYAIGQVHVIAPLAPPMGEGLAKGHMGTTFRVDPEMVKGLGVTPLPFLADIEISTVMRFGKPETTVTAVRPVPGGK